MLKRLCCSLVLLSGITSAQENLEELDLPPWYQFEMLVFAFEEPATQETLRFSPFDKPDQDAVVAEDNASYKTFSLNELYGETIDFDALLNTELEAAVPDSDQEQSVADMTTQTEATEVTESEPSLEALLAAVPELLAVEEENQILNKYAEMFKYRRAYRVLWHQAWQQPLPPDSEKRIYQFSAGVPVIAPPVDDETDQLDQLAAELSNDDEGVLLEVEPLSTDAITDAAQLTLADPLSATSVATVIDSLEDSMLNELPSPLSLALKEAASQVDSRLELQGEVLVYRKTFAHLIFDLWFAEIDDDIASQPYLFVDVEQLEQQTSVDEADIGSETSVSAADFLAETADQTTDDSLPAEETEPRFIKRYEQAFTAKRFGHIKEDRRVRSEELYYVDHPLFGIVLKMVEVPHPLLRENSEQELPESTTP